MHDRVLNRALLARQHLLERTDAPLVEVVEAIGAMQGQAWGALPVGLATRMTAFQAQDLYDALDAGDLRWGIGLRGTLHLVSARQHPAYARAAGTDGWARHLKETSDGMHELRAAVLQHCATRRTGEELAEFAEAWVAKHPDAIDAEEVAAQRKLKWRPIVRWSRLVRVPDGPFTAKAPADHLAATGRRPSEAKALEAVARAHLAAFGPATAADVASFTGRKPAELKPVLDDVAELDDGFYDLPDAARPDPDTEAPPRFLGAFDSSLLAYAPKARTRILPADLTDLVYNRANLQIKPAFLLDGFVAGIWSLEAKKKTATITLTGGPKRIPKALREEGERLLQVLYPDAEPRVERD